MPLRFDTALHQAIAALSQEPGVMGLLFFGSALRGDAGPSSDLDLYAILDEAEAWSSISMRTYAGVPAEVIYGPVRHFRRMLEQKRVVVLHAFATGRPVHDPDGVVNDLISTARALLAAGPDALTQAEIDRWRYTLTDLANDLDDVAGQHANSNLVGGLLVNRCLEAFCALHRLWGEKPKRLLAYVDRHDPAVGLLARRCLDNGLDIGQVQGLVDAVLAPFGGRIGDWDSGRRPVE